MGLYRVLFIFTVVFYGCSDEDNDTTPLLSKGEEAMKEVIEELESKPELSAFVEVLKTVNVANLSEEKLTVFAVKNSGLEMAKRQVKSIIRAAVVDSASIKRHIAKGSYAKNELTHGMILKSIDDENLYVTRDENGFVYINGVVVEGEAIRAGNSYVYMIPEVLQSQPDQPVNPGLSLTEIRHLWNQNMTKYSEESKVLESQLITGYGGFDYQDVQAVSDKFWTLAYQVLEDGEKYLADMAEMEEAKGLSDSIVVEIAVLRTQLYGYYGQILYGGKGLDGEQAKNQLIEVLEGQIASVSSELSQNAQVALAKVYIWSQKYNEAREVCNKTTEKSNEIWTIEAIAAHNTGDNMQAMEKINLARKALQLQTVASIDNAILIETCHACLNGEGQLYPYYRLLETPINYLATVAGFNEEKHFYLPIPKDAMDKYGLGQNKGY